jgi:ATP-dependent DNA ligase
MLKKSSAAQKSSGWRGRDSRCGTWSCLIDGEVVACDENGLAVFDLVRHGSRRKTYATLIAFKSLMTRRRRRHPHFTV